MTPDVGAAGANELAQLAQEMAQMRDAIDANTDAIASFVRDLRMSLKPEALRHNPSSKASPKDRQEYPKPFLSFWKEYPLKRDKRKALLAWNRAIKRASNGAIIEGAKRYASDANRVEQFTKYAEGWLNADGWEDEPLPARAPQRGYESAATRILREVTHANRQQPGREARLGLPGPSN